MTPQPPPDMDLPHPYVIDTLTVGERKQIADNGGNPDEWVGVRLPVAHLQPDYASQAMIAAAPLNRRILRQPKILLGHSPPLYVGPSHVRIVLRRADIGDDVKPQIPPAGEVEFRSVLKVKATLDDAWPDVDARAWAVAGVDLEHIAVSSLSTWLSEGEGWARAYRLHRELSASGFEVAEIRVDVVTR